MKGPDGKAIHAEVRHKGGVVMMGCPGSDYQNPEGHQWSFAQHVREVSPEDMHP